MTRIANLTRNHLGTVSFDGRFKGQRKPQDFIVYPLHGDAAAERIKIQSDTRIGFIDLREGTVTLAGPYPGGAYNPHLAFAKRVDQLDGEELLLLKSHVLASASGHAGSNGVIYTDNSGALGAFGAQA